jgi:hypothetical protein
VASRSQILGGSAQTVGTENNLVFHGKVPPSDRWPTTAAVCSTHPTNCSNCRLRPQTTRRDNPYDRHHPLNRYCVTLLYIVTGIETQSEKRLHALPSLVLMAEHGILNDTDFPEHFTGIYSIKGPSCFFEHAPHGDGVRAERSVSSSSRNAIISKASKRAIELEVVYYKRNRHPKLPLI